MTYLNDLLDKVRDATVCKDLPLGRLVVEKDIEGGVLVRTCPLVESTLSRKRTEFALGGVIAIKEDTYLTILLS